MRLFELYTLMDVTLYIITTWREVDIVTLQPGHHRPFQIVCEPRATVRVVYFLYIITTWREVDIVTLRRQHHRPFQIICEPCI